MTLIGCKGNLMKIIDNEIYINVTTQGRIVPGLDITNDCFSKGQIESKLWLVNEIKQRKYNLGMVFICAGWYAILAKLLFESEIAADKIRSFDINENCLPIADKINLPYVQDDWRFKAITEDIHNIDYSNHSWSVWSKKNNRYSYPITDNPDTIINTSCEHIDNFKGWYDKIPDGKFLILQSNNFEEPEDHINTVKNIDEFIYQVPMQKYHFSGTKSFDKYDRYMIIGIK